MGDELVVPVMSPVRVPFLLQLGTSLADHGHTVSYVPQNRSTYSELRGAVPESELVSGHLSHDPTSPLDDLLSKYGIHSPRTLVFPQVVYDFNYDSPDYSPLSPLRIAAKRTQEFQDSVIDGQPEHWPRPFSNDVDFEPYVRALHRFLDFFDELFAAGDGGIPVHEQGGEILRRVLQRVAEFHDVPSVWAGFSPLPGHSGLYTTEDSYWSHFEAIDIETLTDAEVDAATQHIERVHSERPVVGHRETTRSSVLTARLEKLLAGDVTALGVADFLVDRLRARYNAFRYLSREETTAFIRDNSFVFFPLQYPLESRLTMRSSEFYNQAWLVEFLSRSLPHGVELATKDHPEHVGLQRSSVVDVMRRYSHPLAPGTNTHEILEEAAAVVCLNNTVGYEAIVHGTPVVTLGDAVYSGHEYTIDVADVGDLPEALDRAVRSDGLDRETVIEFCHGILAGSYPGEWHETTDENVRDLAASIAEFVAEVTDDSGPPRSTAPGMDHGL